MGLTSWLRIVLLLVAALQSSLAECQETSDRFTVSDFLRQRLQGFGTDISLDVAFRDDLRQRQTLGSEDQPLSDAPLSGSMSYEYLAYGDAVALRRRDLLNSPEQWFYRTGRRGGNDSTSVLRLRKRMEVTRNCPPAHIIIGLDDSIAVEFCREDDLSKNLCVRDLVFNPGLAFCILNADSDVLQIELRKDVAPLGDSKARIYRGRRTSSNGGVTEVVLQLAADGDFVEQSEYRTFSIAEDGKMTVYREVVRTVEGINGLFRGRPLPTKVIETEKDAVGTSQILSRTFDRIRCDIEIPPSSFDVDVVSASGNDHLPIKIVDAAKGRAFAAAVYRGDIPHPAVRSSGRFFLIIANALLLLGLIAAFYLRRKLHNSQL